MRLSCSFLKVLFCIQESFITEWMTLYHVVIHMLANVENQLDVKSSGLSIFWWAIFILVDLICWWVIFILVGYLCSVGLYILVGFLYFTGPSVFWWANLILLGIFIQLTCLYSAELSTKIVFVTGYKMCVHTLHSILQYVCFIVKKI